MGDALDSDPELEKSDDPLRACILYGDLRAWLSDDLQVEFSEAVIEKTLTGGVMGNDPDS